MEKKYTQTHIPERIEAVRLIICWYIIVFSGLDNFVNDVSEGMTNLKNKYSDRLPSNITTLNVKNSTDEKDFLSYGNSAKSLYLLLQES